MILSEFLELTAHLSPDAELLFVDPEDSFIMSPIKFTETFEELLDRSECEGDPPFDRQSLPLDAFCINTMEAYALADLYADE